MSDEQITERPYLCVMVELTDLWAIQKQVNYNTFLFDPRNGKPMFPSTMVTYPSGVVSLHTAWKLRTKVNSLILRFVQEEVTDRLPLPVDYDEAWLIDSVMFEGSYAKARLMLVQVLAVIWEHEMGMPIKTGVINDTKEGADPVAAPHELVQYVSSLNEEEQGNWTVPPAEGVDPEGTGV